MDCHSRREMHGDGTAYASILATGAMDTRCGNCHTPLVSNEHHEVHSALLDCSACHVQGMVTCYNCHFETELDENRKKSYAQFTDWLFLVNYDGKVHSANFQNVKYRDHTFLAMAPFLAHTIQKNARTCGDCHEGAPVTEYVETGAIQVTYWDASANRLTQVGGVVPVPPDWETSLRFDFVDLDENGNWVFLEAGPDRFQMLFGEPLTESQIEKLARLER